MKIAFVKKSLYVVGGGVKLMLALAYELENRGHEVDIYICDYDKRGYLPEKYQQLNLIPLRSIDEKGRFFARFMWELSKRFFPIFGFIDMYRVARVVTKKNYGIINAHESLGCWFAFCAKLLRYKVPVIWTLNDISLKTPYYKGLRKIVTKLLSNTYMKMERFFCKNVTLITVLDSRNKRAAEEYFKMDRVGIVRCGVENINISDSYLDSSRAKHGLNGMNVVMCHASFSRHRRFEDVICAVARLRESGGNIGVLIVGDRRWDEAYYRYICGFIKCNNYWDFVRIIDHPVSDEELTALFNTSSVFVFSGENQTWGLAPLFAMVNGCPVVVSNGCGVHEVLENGQDALIYDVGNVDQLVEKIRFLVDNPVKRNSIADNGRRLVLDRFTVSHYTTEMLKSFERLAQ